MPDSDFLECCIEEARDGEEVTIVTPAKPDAVRASEELFG